MFSFDEGQKVLAVTDEDGAVSYLAQPSNNHRYEVGTNMNLMKWRAVYVSVAENGWLISTVWGTGTYSSNHQSFLTGDPFIENPGEVEVAVISADDQHQWCLIDGEMVAGWVSAAEYQILAKKVAELGSPTGEPTRIELRSGSHV